MSVTMNNDILARLTEAVAQAGHSFHRLVLLVGPSGTGKTGILRQLAESQGGHYLNINLQLSQRLLELPRSKRPRQVDRILNTLTDEPPNGLFILDNLEIIFDRTLQLDPLRFLTAASRKHTLVAAWSGTMHDGVLTYAEPDHVEYKSYRNIDFQVVSLSLDTIPNH